ncbi:MAG: gamma-glutamylcyclotransferase family protein [Pseudomonadota bacterium]
MNDAWFFGYGSLVNRATHAHDQAHPALLTGWRRVWRHTTLRPIAFLTVIPDPDAEIDGLIAAVPGADWTHLDDRERAYDRVSVPDVRHGTGPVGDIHLYTIPDGKHGRPDRLHPVLLSYIDVVVEGYLNEFGTDGVDRFFATTDGWDAPIADDRKKPRYPRHRNVPATVQRMIDVRLSDRGADVIGPEPLRNP